MNVVSKAFIIVLLFIGNFRFASAQWKQDSFAIGADFNPAPMSYSYKDSLNYVYDVKMAQAAYINLFLGYTNTARYTDYNYIAYQLRVLSILGLPMLLRVPATYNAANEKQVFNFTAGLDSISRLVLYGYNIFDEPRMTNLQNIDSWIAAIDRYDPQRLGYVNLLPVYAFQSRRDYEKYLRAFLFDDNDDPSSIDLVSYDFYPFVENNIRPDYFYNLAIIRKMAGLKPFWAYVLSVPHAVYLNPSPYQLYFQIFCALAYGAKGYMFYTYETIPHSVNYVYGNAIVGRNGALTSKYEVIKQINHYVHDIIGPIIMNSRFMGAFHVANQPYFQFIPSDEYIGSNTPIISQISDKNLLIGVFADDLDNNEYNVLLVNKADGYEKGVMVSIRGDHHRDISVSTPIKDYNGSTKFGPVGAVIYDSSSNLTRVKLDFAPGEPKVLKVLNVDNPYEKVIYPKNFDLKVYPNPISSNGQLVYSLATDANISINIYDMDGRLKKILLPVVHLSRGKYYLSFNRAGLSKGIYLVSLNANGIFYGSKKIIIN